MKKGLALGLLAGIGLTVCFLMLTQVRVSPLTDHVAAADQPIQFDDEPGEQFSDLVAVDSEFEGTVSVAAESPQTFQSTAPSFDFGPPSVAVDGDVATAVPVQTEEERLRATYVELARERAELMTLDELNVEIDSSERQTDELRAKRKLEEATELLQSIVERHPDSGAASAAKEMLETDPALETDLADDVGESTTSDVGPEAGNVVDDDGQRQAVYAFDRGSYEWLRGLVGFERQTESWHIIYSMIPDKDDDFGGNITLLANDKLKSLRQGDFVEIRGRIDPDSLDEFGMPRYRVDEIRRLNAAGDEQESSE